MSIRLTRPLHIRVKRICMSFYIPEQKLNATIIQVNLLKQECFAIKKMTPPSFPKFLEVKIMY